MEKFKDYDEKYCWQYSIRLNNEKKDLIESNLTIDETSSLKIKDFTFQYEEKVDVYDEVKSFIEKHEWLGRMSLYPTHFFTARYKGILAGVVVMDMPTAFSKLLGDDTKKIERLISRGACISWSPKNLASKLISFSIKWMVKNTNYRLFTAYSDTEAKELGTIYQASNFYYLGKNAGASYQYKIPTGRWVSDRYFRSRSIYKKIALENGIIWEKDWNSGDRVFFDKMPKDIEDVIRFKSKEYQNSCQKRKLQPKHKYAFIMGVNKVETKLLRNKFLELNKVYNYPNERGK